MIIMNIYIVLKLDYVFFLFVFYIKKGNVRLFIEPIMKFLLITYFLEYDFLRIRTLSPRAACNWGRPLD